MNLVLHLLHARDNSGIGTGMRSAAVATRWAGASGAPDAEAISHEQITTHRHLCVHICLDTLDMCTQSLAQSHTQIHITQYSFIQFFLHCENLGTIQSYTYQGCNSQHMENSAIIRLHKAESKVTSKMTTLTNAVIHKPINLPSSAGRCQEVTLFCICWDPCCHISSRRPPHQQPMVEAWFSENSVKADAALTGRIRCSSFAEAYISD